MKVGAGIGQGHGVDAVLDLAAVPVVLTFYARRLSAAFGGSRLVDQAQGLRVRMLGCHQLLAAVAEPLFVPPDRFEKSLERAGSNPQSQRDRLHILTLHAAEQPANISRQEQPASGPAKAVGKQTQKLGQQFSERCDILKRHGTTLRGFLRKRNHTEGRFFHPTKSITITSCHTTT